MAGYLGKISAIVSANTADFQSKLSAAAKDVQKFASSMQGALSSAQTKSATALRGIYTEAQKLDRALQAVSSRKLSFKGFQGRDLEEAVNRMKALYSTTQQISGPLSSSAKAFEKLSSEVQSHFLPALISAQKSTEALADTINKTGTVSEQRFDAVAKKVNLVREAIGRLTEASSAVAQLEGGAGLKFSSPRQFDVFASAAEQQKRAAGLSGAAAARLGIGPQQQALSNQARAVEALMADRERLMARGQATGGVDAAIARETDRLEAQLRVYGRLIDAAQKYDLVRRGGFVSVNDLAGSAANSGIARTDKLADRVGQSSPMDRNAGSIGARTDISFLERLGGRLVGPRTDISNMGMSSPFFPGNGRSNPTGEFGPSLPPGFGGRSDAGLGAAFGDSARQLEQFRSGVASVKGQLDSLPAPVRTHFIPAVQAAEQEFIRLAALGPRATAEEIENATNNMRVLTAAARRAQTGSNFEQNFGGNPQDFELGLQTRSLQSYQAQLQVLQQNLGRVSAEARGPAAASFIRLSQAISTAFQNGTLDTEETRREIEGLTRDAVAATAAVANVSASGLARDIRRAGDIGRGGFDRLSLAANQAAFAIDDFLSSTGGIEFKLRAISNNITQLAFIVGNTTGLFIGLAAVIGGQLAVGLMKWANSGRTAEDSTKALNDALARQKSLVEDLAQAFDSLGDSIGRKGFSAAGQKASEFEKEISRIEEKQKNLREEKVAALDPRVLEARASVNVAQKKVEEATTVGQSVLAQRELEEARRREREAVRNAVARPSPTAAEAQREIVAVLERETRVRAAAAARSAEGPVEKAMAVQREMAAGEERVRNVRVQGDAEDIKKAIEQQIVDLIARGAPDVEIARLQALVESLQSPIQQLRDKALVQVLRAADSLANSLEQSQVIINSAFGDSASAIRAVLDRTTNRLQEVQKQAENSQNPEAFEADIAALEDHVNELKAAAMAVSAFSDEMRRAAESFSADVAARQQMAEEARREDLKTGTPETAARRERAEREAKEATQAEREFRDQQATERERIEQEMMHNGQSVADRMRQIDEQLAVPANEMSASGVRGGTVAEREALREERRQLQARVDAEVEASPAVRAQRERRDDQTRQLEQDRRRRADADQGRSLSMTPAQREAEELGQGIEQIRQFFGEQAELGNGIVDREAQREAVNRFIEDRQRAVAPAIFDLREQVENARLQGPSKAALNVSDVSTMEGSRELSRLLRGQDSATENLNLVELRKQSAALDSLNKTAAELKVRLGVAN